MSRRLLLLENRGQCTACTVGMDQEFVLWSQSLRFTLMPNSSAEPEQQLDCEDALWCRPEQQLESGAAVWCGSQGKSSGHQKGLSWV